MISRRLMLGALLVCVAGSAIAQEKTPALAPDVPTFRELGYNIEGNGWYALFAPATTPQDRLRQVGTGHIRASGFKPTQ